MMIISQIGNVDYNIRHSLLSGYMNNSNIAAFKFKNLSNSVKLMAPKISDTLLM
jgi:hypothetical protein